ncbi:MAG: BrnA antitoxin family protein [Caulobacteraceae bacterium]|nr:BrnA antitoxin family protein [Caulobacteraceae bacterium]
MKPKLDNPNAETPPPLTDAQREHLAELAAMPDETIDTSDIPELTDEAWAAGVRGRFYRPVKQQITARVDADVLDWLKSQGKGYQGRLNAILRREMLASLKRMKRAWSASDLAPTYHFGEGTRRSATVKSQESRTISLIRTAWYNSHRWIERAAIGLCQLILVRAIRPVRGSIFNFLRLRLAHHFACF